MIEVRVDDSVLQAKVKRLPEDTRARLRAVIVKDNPQLAGLVRGKLSGSVLHTISGALLGSIRNEMVENATSIYGRVSSVGVIYARIHEYGGTTKAHIIRAVNAQSLHFMMGGKDIFVREVHHPGSKIPSRSYMRSSLAELRMQIVDDLTRAVVGTWDSRQ